MSIEVSAITKIYGEQKAVNNVSFSVAKGEIVGFLGPNGAGKSTTMKMITGYLKPTEGKATVSGIDVQAEPLAAKRKIGYLSEANPLYYDMYVREYLGFVGEVHGIAHRKKRIDDIIDTVGLTNERRKKTGQLSKGYKQRVGLAAALLHDPEVMILDEPTTGLDPNQIIEIREVIRRLGRDKTVLFSSHILQEVQALCDRVIIINKGELIADASIAALQRSDERKPFVEVQFAAPPGQELMSTVAGVVRVEEVSPAQWRLFATEPDAVRKELLQLSLRHNLNIVSLQTGEQSLEQVFRQLTSPGDKS